ncbi:TPA: phage tail spike protein [Streptococcus suis]
MKPILFKANETKFDTYGLGEIDASKAIVTRERNGNYTLYIEYPANGPMSNVFQREMKIKADAGVRTKNQTFEIGRINRNSKNIIKIYAKHISHKTELMGLNPVVSVSKVGADVALQTWAANLVGGIRFDTWSDITTPNSTSWEVGKVENARQALGGVAGSILDVWGGEFEFDNTLIKLHKQLGRKTPTVLEYGRNILSAEEDEDIEDTPTSIYPFATYQPQTEGATNQDPVVVTLPERIVDSEHVNAYADRRVKLVDLSSKFGEKEIPTEDKLRSAAQAYIKANNIGVPDINTKIEYVDLATTLDYEKLAIVEEIELCDIVPIYYPSLGITNEEGKVVVIDYNVLLDRNEKVEIGSIGKGIKSALTENVSGRIDALESQQKAIAESIVPYLVNATGNRIWYVTPDPNIEHKVGDVWFEKNGIYERMYIWNGEDWEKRIDTEADMANFNQRLSEIDTQAQAMEAAIQENEAKAREALEQAGASADLASEAQRIADETKQAHTSLSQEVNEAKADLVQKGLELSQMGEMLNNVAIDLDQKISFKAEKVEMDQLLGRVSQTETQLIVNMEQIHQRMTRTEVDALVNQKGYLSASVFNNYKTETAQSLTQRFEEMRGLIPDKVGGRNYYRNSEQTQKSIRFLGFPVAEYLAGHIGETWTFSFDCWINEDGIERPLRFYRYQDHGRSLAINQQFNPTKVRKRFHFTGTVVERYADDTLTPGSMAIYDYAGNNSYSVANVKLEIGTIPTDWTPAPEDLALPFENFKNEYDRTAKHVIDNLSSVIQTDSQWYTTINNRLRTAEGNFDTLSRTKANQTDFQTVKTTTEIYEQILGKSQGDIQTNASRLVMTSDVFQTEVKRQETNADILARVSDGVSVVSDPTFDSGLNGIVVYDNTQSGNITITRQANVVGSTQPNGKNNRLMITHRGLASPNFGGIYRIPSGPFRANAMYAIDFIAMLPTGRSFSLHNNSLGTGGSVRWVTSDKGTGTWTRYVGLWTLGPGHHATAPIAYVAVKDGPTPSSTTPLTWYLQSLDIRDITQSGSQALSTKVTQLAGSWAVQNLDAHGKLLNQINLLANGTNRIDGRLTHITGQTKIDNAVITSAMIQSVDAGKIITGTLDAAKARIINLDINTLTGNKSTFLQSMWRATNSLSYIDGTKIQVRGNDGSYVEMNNVPEFRSSDPTGTATVMGMGRTHYLDKYGTSLGYIGMNLYDFDFGGTRTYAGTKYGVWLSRGSGGFSINYMQDGGYVAGTNNVYYTTKAGETYPVAVIEAVMRYKGNSGNWGNFEWVKSTLSNLNGYGAWPWNTTFQVGDRVIIEKGTVSTYIAAGYQRYLDCTTSSNGTPTIYTYTEVRHQLGVVMEKSLWVKGEARVGSLRNDSDRRLKENIKNATSSALEELMALKVVEFDWKQSGQHQDYGLIAQEAGKFRVPASDEDDTESIDLTRLLHASVKAIQELTERVKKLETRTIDRSH